MGTENPIWKELENSSADNLRKKLDSEPELARARDTDGVSLLLRAAYQRKDDIVQVYLSFRDELDIFEAAALGKLDRVKRWIDEEPGQLARFSPDGFTPLHLACFFGNLDCARLLVDRGAEVGPVSRNPMTVTPLGSAAASGHRAIVELLLTHGAEVDRAQRGGFTPLHSAAHNGNEALVEILLTHGANPERKAEDGRSAADFARENGHDAIAQRLTSGDR
jgi:ankyrin repeat protein